MNKFILLFALFLAQHSLAAAADRPNVLLICVDDLKPLLGCYGDLQARSPHIDAMAARGVLFERAYCNQAVCAPSRNALLTGLRSTTLGIYDLGTNFRKSRPDAITLPQIFKQNGYRTEGLGKIFHVGHGNHEDPVSWSVPHWKSNVVAYALPESKAQEGLTREEALFDNKPAQGLPKGAAWEMADVPDEAYPDGALAAETVRRLQAAKARTDQPFFMAVGFVKPHLPFVAPKKYWDIYRPDQLPLAQWQEPPKNAPAYAPQFGGELRQYRDIPEKGALDPQMQRQLVHGYYAAMSYMDAQLGKVLAELDRLELSKNTVVVLWGDHGWHLGDHGIWCKHTNYEQATRIPILIAAPGIKAARVSGLVETVDLYPTLCELAGIKIDQPMDGRSLAGVLNHSQAATKDFVFHAYPRSPVGRGQLIGRAIRTPRYRLVEWKKPGAPSDTADIELYDYELDPLEKENLASAQPEVVQKLRELLASQAEAKPQIKAGN